MHHVFLPPTLTGPPKTTTGSRLIFISIPIDQETISHDAPFSQSLNQRLKRSLASDSQYHSLPGSAIQYPPGAQRRADLFTVLEGSEADISWSISHIHHDPSPAEPSPAPGSSSKRQKRQQDALVHTRPGLQSVCANRSEESIGPGPTPSIMHEHLAESASPQTDDISALPGHFVKASELVRRAVGPRRSSRLRLSGT